ncbi:xylulokinase [Desertimonas flava]|uniref:xylulokinase n=1 Tax=Desertimonas flava TaxID=2064846 RepID=UPI000E34D2EE|nr:xylulokinase [Desertimonas flava]
MSARRVAGVDSSTQSCKVVVCDVATGRIVDEGRAPHRDGTEADPEDWWHALGAAGDGRLDAVAAIGVAGQQHGMVTLSAGGSIVRPALLWNDNRSAGAAAELTAEVGGPGCWSDAVGSELVASFTVTKLRWLARNEPDAARRVAAVALPHDWLTWRLLGGGDIDALTTDRGDASGTGYWSPRAGEYRADLVELAFGRSLIVPRVAGPAETVGTTASGAAVAAGTGDNMGAALGLGLRPGDVVVSLGTSGTVFACADAPSSDATGAVAGFADATGRFLPLVCTLNAARVLDATAAMLGTNVDELAELALTASPGSGGLTMLPYLDGERTPALPDASGSLHGMRRENMTAANVARAAVEGVLCGLADGLDALRAVGVEPARVLLIGGAARSRAVREIAPDVFGVDVAVPVPGEYVAVGAARQAAWALTGELPDWPVATESVASPTDSNAGAAVRGAYAEWRTATHG